jgi:hypothetical protein
MLYEIIVLSTMNPRLSSLFLLCSPPVFGPAPACRLRFSLSVTSWPFCKLTRHGVCAFNVPTGCCGSSYRASGRAGADVCGSFNLPQ